MDRCTTSTSPSSSLGRLHGATQRALRAARAVTTVATGQRGRITAAIAATLLTLATTSARAAEPSPEQTCSRGRASALQEISCELAKGLAGKAAGAVVVSGPLATDSLVNDPNELIKRLLGVVTYAIGARAGSLEALDIARARSIAARNGRLVYLRPQIARGELRVTLDLYHVPKSFWDRVKNDQLQSEAHAYGSRALDAELHTFLPPVPLVAAAPVWVAAPERRAVALACGDLEGDGSLELVLVGRQRVSVGRVREKKLKLERALDWSTLSPIAPTPLREPIASAVIDHGNHLLLGSSDRKDAVRLNPAFATIERWNALLPWPGGGCTELRGTALFGEARACSQREPLPAAARVAQAADALAGATIVTRSGELRTVRAARLAAEPTVVLVDNKGRSARVSALGAQLAVSDLDFDGQPELIAGSDTLDPNADALVVFTWLEDGRVIERQRIPARGGVFAIAVCPPEDAGRPLTVAATTDGLWLVR